MLTALSQTEGISHLQRYTITQGILKTDSDFLGVAFKGVGSDFDTLFLHQNLREGMLPRFGSTEAKQQLLLSSMMADKLRLKTGDRVFAYFISDDDVRVRRFTLTGIYQTNMTQFDQSLCFTDYSVPLRLNGWEPDQASGAELTVGRFDAIDSVAARLVETVNRSADRYGEVMTSQTIYEAYPQVFNWLELLDINVWIILALMVAVAGFTMISGLLIIILERTQMIGVLKAIGARNKTIRHTFLWFSVFIIGRGLLLGNIIGLGIVLLQKYTGLVKLDPQTYYVSEAPMELNLPLFVLLNIATLLICVFVLIAPSYLISHIHPAKSMRYE
jgi:lipoprotein-releasing system permease protein